ncbi:MAG TPA: DUF6314 family protein [Kiloniellales bacterium]|nr:DUF6314 family protein [Kiloniellales bacterium]
MKSFLEGRWELDREVLDHRLGRAGRFHGTADFAPGETTPDSLDWREIGRLRFGAHEGPGEQRYRLDFAAPHCARVRYADGRIFHDLDLSTGSWTVEHACGPDLYRGRFAVSAADRWTLVWRVTGPRKDLRLSTCYRRL